MRIYLETTILVMLCFGKQLEPQKYDAVEELFRRIERGEVEAVVSFYSLHELYVFAIENFPEDISRSTGKEALMRILSSNVEISPLLDREKRIMYGRELKIRDSSDVPHAISAVVEGCDCLVTYDSHFRDVADKISVKEPEDLIT
ncbi:MAG: type II toxin-antitoxin system VapC family toxin [Candidatus Freyarchaeota archaeon]